MKVSIFINGISNIPGNPRDWNARAVTWTHTQGSGYGEKVQYFCGPIGRAFGQDERAQRLKVILSAYSGWDIRLVGHSNGAAVALLALQDMGWPNISVLHLLSGACEADFEKNGLNSALRGKKIGAVAIYDAGKDNALQAANCWLGRMLGYGVLGLHGPQNVASDVKVAFISEPDYAHSSWWDAGARFEKTMNRLMMG